MFLVWSHQVKSLHITGNHGWAGGFEPEEFQINSPFGKTPLGDFKNTFYGKCSFWHSLFKLYFPQIISIKLKLPTKITEILPNQLFILFTVHKLKSLSKVKAGEYPIFLAKGFSMFPRLCTSKPLLGKSICALLDAQCLCAMLSTKCQEAPDQPAGSQEPERVAWGRFEAFYACICLFAFQMSISPTTATNPIYFQMSTSALHEPGKTLLTILCVTPVSPYSCWRVPAGKTRSGQACPWPGAGLWDASAHVPSQRVSNHLWSRGSAAPLSVHQHLLLPINTATVSKYLWKWNFQLKL